MSAGRFSFFYLQSVGSSWDVSGSSVFVLTLLSPCPSTGVGESVKCCSFSGSLSSSLSSLNDDIMTYQRKESSNSA